MIWVMFLRTSVPFYFLPDAVIIFSERECAWVLKLTQSRITVQYLWGRNSPLMFTIFSVFAVKKEGIMERYLGGNLKWVTVALYSHLCATFSRATVCICKAYCTFALHASSLFSSTANCLSALCTVIFCSCAVRQQKKCIQSHLSHVNRTTGQTWNTLWVLAGDGCKGNVFYFKAALGNVTQRLQTNCTKKWTWGSWSSLIWC